MPEASCAALGNKTLIGRELAQLSEQCASYFSQLALSLLWTVHLIDNSANQHVTFSVILFTLSQNYTAGWKQTLGKPSDPAGCGWFPHCSSAASPHGRAGCDQYHIPPNASFCHLSEKWHRSEIITLEGNSYSNQWIPLTENKIVLQLVANLTVPTHSSFEGSLIIRRTAFIEVGGICIIRCYLNI